MASKNLVKAGELVYAKVEKIVRHLNVFPSHSFVFLTSQFLFSFSQNAELFTLTYGALVAQLIKDFEEVDEVNKQLEKMLAPFNWKQHVSIPSAHTSFSSSSLHFRGYNIGLRLIDEFLSKSNTGSCSDFRETAETIAKVGFKMFLGITATVTGWNETATEFSLILDENPLNDFVELPESYRGLSYSNILCGVVRGALEMVHLRVDCINTRCTLRGDDVTELKITLKEVMKEVLLVPLVCFMFIVPLPHILCVSVLSVFLSQEFHGDED